ncbi:MAG: integrase arm-type DNA-binding domain-containing protein [Nitrincola sp.]|nr:integrase arm-type DNA-binding domain-containing protein [Nitrincola sp.]
MKLTDKQIKTVNPTDKPFKLSDGKGLYLLVNPNGSKYWRMKYRFQGKEQKLALGIYPDVSLKQARLQCDEARQQLANGINPSTRKKTSAAANKAAYENSFVNVAREWLEVHSGSVTPLHIKKITSLLERFVYPEIGAYPITDIDTPTVLEALRKIESTGKLETMQRAKRTAGQIFTFAIASGKATNNPVLPLAKGVLKTPKETHRAAITTPSELGRLMMLISNYRERGSVVVECALKCSALWLLRQGELRF